LILLHRGAVADAGSPAMVMRADVLERVYQWPLVVSRDPAVGAPALIPLRRAGAGAREAGGRATGESATSGNPYGSTER
jgi:hypothetical protein